MIKTKARQKKRLFHPDTTDSKRVRVLLWRKKNNRLLQHGVTRCQGSKHIVERAIAHQWGIINCHDLCYHEQDIKCIIYSEDQKRYNYEEKKCI